MSQGFNSPTTCAIALGGNIGDPASVFQQALKILHNKRTRVTAVSPLLTSSAMGSAAGDAFVNAAAILETDLNPFELLVRLHDVEHTLGRVRTIHWGPRRIDLDLLLYEQQVIDSASLVVPHPAMWHRRFVLEPLAQIAPDLKHPVLQQTVRQLYQHLQQRPVLIAISSAASSRIAVSELQYDLNNRFGSNAVKLIAETTPNDSWFAFLDLESHVEAFEHRRTQPAQQPDRTIIIQATGDAPDVIIRQTIVDLCAGVLG